MTLQATVRASAVVWRAWSLLQGLDCIKKEKKKKKSAKAIKCMGYWAAHSQGQNQPCPPQPCVKLWCLFFCSFLDDVFVTLYKLQQFFCERPDAKPKVEKEVQLL